MAARNASTTRLALARIAAGYQQQGLASLAGISAARLCEYERGVRPPEVRQTALADALDYPIGSLFPGDLVVGDEEMRRWLTEGDASNKIEESAARPTLRDHAGAGGGHDSA